MSEIIDREARNGVSYVLIGGIVCPNCGGPAENTWLEIHEPRIVCCAKCREASEDYGVVVEVEQFSKPRPTRAVAGESEPGKSSGKPRKHMSMGDAENGNGFWDNMVKASEE